MTIHRRLEERLGDFLGRDGAIVFGAGLEATTGVIGALAGPGDIVFSDEFNQPSIADGCLLSGAKVFVYEHLDLEHLAWGIENTDGRGALIVSESLFSINGDLAPLTDLAYLAERHRIRLMIDESHALGTIGADGRGAVAEAGLEDQVDLLVGSLDNALGSSGAFVACDEDTGQYLRGTARTFIFGTAPPPPALAGALAALELLQGRPELVRRLQANASALRRELAREGAPPRGYETHILAVPFGGPALATQATAAALQEGLFVHALAPPAVLPATAGLRLSVMASHRPEELRTAARSLGQILARLLAHTNRDGAWESERFESERLKSELFDEEADNHRPRGGVFDLEADERLAA
jgi:glycine C-acetyltransferase/8-amino-7-oxononanoate synthase